MGVYLTGFYNIAWSMALSLVASNTAGATKKSFVSASIAIAHGNILPNLFHHIFSSILIPVN